MVKKRAVKQLYRASGRESMLGGVCAGIANYFAVDPTLIRLTWVLMTIFSFGTGVLGYLVMWVIMPRR